MPQPRLELADWGPRVGAALVDGCVVVGADVLLGQVAPVLGALAGLGLLVWFAWSLSTTGQTIGKKALSIRLVKDDEDGEHVAFVAALIRPFVHVVDAIPLMLGYVWPLWDTKHQTFTDKVMSTVVVKA